jgi:RNA polymerase sigma factor (sigma-70 family)
MDVTTAAHELLKRQRRQTPGERQSLAALLAVADADSPLGRAVRAELIAGCYAFAVRSGRRFRGRWAASRRDDLVQAACLGLVLAAANYDPGRGVRFVVYAWAWVRWEVRREFARQRSAFTHRRDTPLAVIAETQRVRRILRATLPDRRPRADRLETEDVVRSLLPEREADVVLRRVGLDGPAETYREIGRRYGVSHTAAEKWFARSRAVLAAHMEGAA